MIKILEDKNVNDLESYGLKKEKEEIIRKEIQLLQLRKVKLKIKP